MLVYPFDPQCRLDSNWIPKETLPAFPSAATRTLVPAHAPFYAKDCKVFKGDKELKEGEDFYFSIEHKVASHATAYRIYGGINIIKDELIPPFTMQYHAQGGTFEATPTQIKSYLDKKPDVWDSSWEALIESTYYPPVKVLYDKEAFVSETEVIAAIKQLEDAIGAKDEKDDASYGLFKVRVDNMRLQLEQLKTDEHLSSKGNPHKAKHFHAGALAKDGIAANSHKIEGLTKQAFIDKLLSLFPPLSNQLENGFQQNTDMSVGERLVIDGGMLVFGDSSVLEMDEEQLTQTSDNAVKIIADREAKRPGATISINAGGNTLTVISTGNTVDSKKLKINDVEVVTEESLKAYATEAVLGGATSLYTADTPTVSMIGSGKIDSPLEASVSLPVSSATTGGTVKVVDEGSHGFPCPGYSATTFYIFHRRADKYTVLRNGADDLETDVFMGDVVDTPLQFVATADRFRPAGLPATAKPTHVRHGTEDVVWLDTTDGSFLLFTKKNPDPDTWLCAKITNSDMNLGYYGTPFVANNKVYVLRTILTANDMSIKLWEAPIPTGNSITFTPVTLTGNNFNGTAQQSTTFAMFDKLLGNRGEKCYYYTDGTYTRFNISHAGDQFGYEQVGGQVRVCHNGQHYMSNSTTERFEWRSLSYVIDFATGRVMPDGADGYPLSLSSNGLGSVQKRRPLSVRGQSYSSTTVRANGKLFACETWGVSGTPLLKLLNNTGNLSNIDNMKWDAQYYSSTNDQVFVGLYGTAIKSSVRGLTQYSNNRMIGLCRDGDYISFQYDPAGTYSPVLSGYGPSNDRFKFDNKRDYHALKRMVWYTDPNGTKACGAWLFSDNLSSYSSYDGDIAGTPTSISLERLNAFKAKVLQKYAPELASSVVDSDLSLMIHRVPGVANLGLLQVLYDSPSGKLMRAIVFTITPNRYSGEVTAILSGKMLYNSDYGPSHKNLNAGDERVHGAGCFIQKLDDGGIVTNISGKRSTVVGRSSFPMIAIINAPAGNVLKVHMVETAMSSGISTLATRELGFGTTWVSPNGEGVYLDSYGRTSNEIVSNIENKSTTRYILAMSRSDAGDNVAVSQYAATLTRDKVQSLIPPARRIQGMDLTQDRVITRAMLENSDRLTNLADIDYPEQPKHHDSLSDCAVAPHTHKPDAFTMAAATKLAYGSAKLSPLSGSESDAVDITVMSAHTEGVRDLIGRDKTLDKLDDSIIVIYEV